MGFLKAIGQAALQVGTMVLGLGPVVKGLYPQAAHAVDTAVSDLQIIEGVITQVEAFANGAGGLSGPQKLQGAIPLVENVILQSAMMAGKQIDKHKLDQWRGGIEQIINGVVACLNASKDDSVQTVTKAS